MIHNFLYKVRLPKIVTDGKKPRVNLPHENCIYPLFPHLLSAFQPKRRRSALGNIGPTGIEKTD